MQKIHVIFRRNAFLLLCFFVPQLLLAQTNEEFTEEYVVTPLNINTGHNEIGAFFLGDRLYFASDRDSSGTISNTAANSKGRFYNVFFSTKKDSGFLAPTRALKLNSPFNDGPVSFNETGTKMLLTSNKANYKFIVGAPRSQQLILSVAAKEGRSWSAPAALPFCSGNNSYCHGAFCKGDSCIIFVSDMAGGFGGTDLYISQKTASGWSDPKNLGSKINSASNELFPFVDAHDKLFFSSDRSGGYGGLDLFSILLKDTVSGNVIHLNKPLNSSYDDFGIWMDSTGSNGYLSSDRSSGTDDDLFSFNSVFPLFTRHVQQHAHYCYTFFEEATAAANDTAGIQYQWEFGDGEKADGLEATHCFKTTGTYPVKLNIVDRSSGELFYNDVSYDFVVEEPEQLVITCADTAFTDSFLIIDASASQIAGCSIKKYYWTFDDGSYNTGPQVRHKYFKEGMYTLKLGILAIDTSGKELTFFSEKKIRVMKDRKETGRNDPGKSYFNDRWIFNRECRRENKWSYREYG